MQVDIQYKNNTIKTLTKTEKVFLDTKGKLFEDVLSVSAVVDEWQGDFKNDGSITISTTAFSDTDFYVTPNPVLQAAVAIINEDGTTISTATTGITVTVTPTTVDEKFSLTPVQGITDGIININASNLYTTQTLDWDNNTIRLVVSYTNPSGFIISNFQDITIRTKYSNPE